MVRGLVLSANRVGIREHEFSRLEDYQAVVGGSIEQVDIPALGITMYVNEEGLLRQLSFNSRATFLWWYHVPELRQRAMLVGDAAIVGLPDVYGDNTDIPEPTLQLFRPGNRFAVEARVQGTSAWSRSRVDYGYFDALVWVMLLNERAEAPIEVKLVSTSANEKPEAG